MTTPGFDSPVAPSPAPVEPTKPADAPGLDPEYLAWKAEKDEKEAAEKAEAEASKLKADEQKAKVGWDDLTEELHGFFTYIGRQFGHEVPAQAAPEVEPDPK